MPAFTFSFTIPKNTLPERPVRKHLAVEGDFITRYELYFPAGHCYLTGVQIRYGELPLWPSEVDQFFGGEDTPVAQDVRWRMPARKIRLTFILWNKDDTYDHTVYGSIFTAFKRELEPVGIIYEVATLIRRAIKRLLGMRGR